MSQNISIAGLVLAGGKSSRMGQDKALLQLNNETLLARNSRILLEAGCSQVFISGDIHGSRQQANAIDDIVDDFGPVGGILSVIRQLADSEHQWLAIIAVDMPNLSPSQLQPLFNDLATTKNGRFFEHSLFPMLIRITSDIADVISQQLATNDKKAKSVYRLIHNLALESLTIEQTQSVKFINVNTPEQWQSCLSQQPQAHNNRG
jgi:molybdopterin-guanine dinucleotide biosynthesis protein A